SAACRHLHSFPTRRSSDLGAVWGTLAAAAACVVIGGMYLRTGFGRAFHFAFAILFAALCIPLTALGVPLLLTILGKLPRWAAGRSEEHTSELQSPYDLVCR